MRTRFIGVSRRACHPSGLGSFAYWQTEPADTADQEGPPACAIFVVMAKGRYAARKTYHGAAVGGAPPKGQNSNGQNGHKRAAGLALLVDLPTDHQFSVLRILDPGGQAQAMALLLRKAKEDLSAAIEASDLAAIVDVKDKALELEDHARELGLSRKLRDDAATFTRRVERQIGLAIRAGQASGELKSHGGVGGVSPFDIISRNELHGSGSGHSKLGIYGLTDGVTDEQFEEALAAARAEGNLSRSVVARKCQAYSRPWDTEPEVQVQVSLDEFTTLVTAMPKPCQMTVLLATWCALGFTELVELRRHDIDIKAKVIHVRRAASRPRMGGIGSGRMGVTVVSTTKPRDVPIHPALLPVLTDHLANFVGEEHDALLFRAQHGGHLAPSTLNGYFRIAREAVNRLDLRFEELRHIRSIDVAKLIARVQSAPPPPRKIRKTAPARKVMEDLIITIASLAFVVEDTDPEEVDLDLHRDDIGEIFVGMATISKFLKKVKEQDS